MKCLVSTLGVQGNEGRWTKMEGRERCVEAGTELESSKGSVLILGRDDDGRGICLGRDASRERLGGMRKKGKGGSAWKIRPARRAGRGDLLSAMFARSVLFCFAVDEVTSSLFRGCTLFELIFEDRQDFQGDAELYKPHCLLLHNGLLPLVPTYVAT